MKKLVLFVAVLLCASNAYSEDIPDGCYVSYANPSFCYQSPSGAYNWEFGAQSYLNAKYGPALGAVIDRYRAYVNSCTASDANRVAEYNILNDKYNSLVFGYNAQLKTITNLKKQIKKLKK